MKIKTIFILVILFFTLIVRVASAQEVVISPSPTDTPTPTPVQYALPYPGILPGHPFYFLKTLRDNVMDFLISNPLKKGEFDLLQADKNMAAVQALAPTKNNPVVLETLGKAEDYFAKAILKAQEANKQGLDMSDLVARLSVANLKHQEVMKDLVKSAQGDDKQKFSSEAEKFTKFGQTVAKLRNK